MLPGLDVAGLTSNIEKFGVTAVALVPTIIYLLIDHARTHDNDLSSLQTVVYAGSPIAPERLRQALETFGPIFIQTYAYSEPGYVSCLRKQDHLQRAGNPPRLDGAPGLGLPTDVPGPGQHPGRERQHPAHRGFR